MADPLHEPYDPEKGPDFVADPTPEKKPQKRHWKFIPNFMTISVPDIHIDRKALENKLRYKYLLIFFLIVSIILSSIAVGSCSNGSTAMANAYLLEFKYDAYSRSSLSGEGVVNQGAYATFNSNANSSDLTIRIGYFATCINSAQTKESTNKTWFCSRNVTTIVNTLNATSEDPFNGIHLMNELRSNVFSPVILIMSVCFTFLAMIVLAAANIKQTSLFFVATGLTLFSCFLGLVALIWQQVGVDTSKSILNNLSNNAILAKNGPVPAGLGWTSVFLLFVVSIGIVALVVNENQALVMLQDFGSDFQETQKRYGQNALNGRSNDESAVNLGGSRVGYPTDTPNVNIPTPY